MSCAIRPIRHEDDEQICRIIKEVGAEYGAIGEGFGPSDPEVQCMSHHYKDANSALYLVAALDNQLIGGSGIASFHGSREICELRKLFLLPESRGMGIGRELTQSCLDYARSKHYTQCYLDTLSSMQSAIALYESFGFKHLEHPLKGTIHSGCDVWMIKAL